MILAPDSGSATVRLRPRYLGEIVTQEGAMSVTTPHRQTDSRTNERTVNRLLDGELLDLYVAILIVVPLAMFLRSLWS